MSDFFANSVFLRPPRTPSGQPALSREQIVKAAIELLDGEGPAGLSMRKLGTHLGAGATSLYWHVANKDDLLELVVDEVMGEAYVPEATDTSWRVGLSVWANGMRAMLLRHPWVAALLGTRPTIGPNAMRMGERAITLLTRAGFEGLEVPHVISLVNSHALGAATTQAAVVVASRKAGVPLPDMAAQMEPYLEKIRPDHPNYDRWRRQNDGSSIDPLQLMEDGFAFGLERILDGLEQWLASKKTA
jgi:AcrR family transcriptional regulator